MGQNEMGIISFTYQSFPPTTYLQGRGRGESKEGKVLPVKVMRPHKGSRGIAPLIPNLDTRHR